MQSRIYLIGFMGSGKSHTGRLLAEMLEYAFFDLDKLVEKDAAMDISEIFKVHGEKQFRALEASCLRKTGLYSEAIIATGGGTPCHSLNMDWMLGSGTTVFLDPSNRILAERLLPRRHHRPLISHLDTLEAMEGFIAEKLSQRRKFYEKAAIHFIPQTAGEEAADLLEGQIRDL